MAPDPDLKYHPLGATAAEFEAEAPELAGDPAGAFEGLSPWQLALRRLRRNRLALVSGAVFLLIVLASMAAPLYARHVAHRGPNEGNVTGKIERGGKQVDVVSPDGIPIGPGLSSQYLLGSDKNGRDVAVRLLYGGRNSLFIGIMSALITTVLAVVLGMLAGYFRGKPDVIVRSLFDIIWSFPVLLLGIALGTALAIGGLKIGPVTINGDSLWIPTLIIGVVLIPYMGRPVRGEVLSLREKEFVESAVSQGMGPVRIMFREVMPNLATTILVFSTLIVAENILFEGALSFLGAGVQAPNASWGNLISDGVDRLTTAPHLTLAPGLMLALTVLSLNVFGDGLRDALDPRGSAITVV